MKEFLLQLMNFLGLAYWVEINTNAPRCTYYFGPFFNETEATSAQHGYIDDLLGEEAQGIQAVVKRCHPQDLTVFEESREERLRLYKLLLINN